MHLCLHLNLHLKYLSHLVGQIFEVELHLHLDGSLSPDFIAERAFARGIPMPASPHKLVSVSVVDVEVDIKVAQVLLLLPS